MRIVYVRTFIEEELILIVRNNNVSTLRKMSSISMDTQPDKMHIVDFGKSLNSQEDISIYMVWILKFCFLEVNGLDTCCRMLLYEYLFMFSFLPDYI